ncbi:hypothetical protein AB0J83_19865 [Actinoplanes sp. NPDC049596]|uniref:hypothetical protein n=1 Tax=unclassified Actinoplanes TaxID=2626549 RepID=UPI0034423AA5
MGEDLRGLLRADLDAERPPPLGDLVDVAMRDGRRVRRRRRLMGGGGAAAVGVLALVVGGGVLSGADELGGVAAGLAPAVTAPVPSGVPVTRAAGKSPGSVPISPPPPSVSPARTRTLAISSGTYGPAEKRKKATSAAMVYLLSQLLPSAATGDYSVAPGGELRVRAMLNNGLGPGMVSVEVTRIGVGPPVPKRGQVAKVSIAEFPDDCRRDTSVVAGWPDGTQVRLDVAACLPDGGTGRVPAPPMLDPDIGAKIAADPRWGTEMDASLVDVGGKRYPDLPVFAG